MKGRCEGEDEQEESEEEGEGLWLLNYGQSHQLQLQQLGAFTAQGPARHSSRHPQNQHPCSGPRSLPRAMVQYYARRLIIKCFQALRRLTLASLTRARAAQHRGYLGMLRRAFQGWRTNYRMMMWEAWELGRQRRAVRALGHWRAIAARCVVCGLALFMVATCVELQGWRAWIRP